MKKKLILITAHFPYGTSETFLESEIPILAQHFEQVEIFTFPVKGQKRSIPANCSVTDILIKEFRLKTFFGIFSSIFWKEILIIKHTYKKKISLGILKTMFISFMRAKAIAQFLNTKIEKKKDYTFYSYWCDDSALALAILNEKNNNSLKTIARTHGWDVYFEVSDYNYLPFRYFIHQNLTQLFPISEKGKSYMEDTWKVNGKISVSRLGVNSQLSILNSTLSTLNSPIKQFTIVSCSNIIPLKRVHLIIEALSLISDFKIHWVHFGDGPEEIALKDLADKKLKDNITYEFKGRVANQKVLEFYSSNSPNLFINVSSSEGIPVSIMEAMSFGIPSVASDVGGNGEIVNFTNGFLLQSNPDALSIKKAIVEIISKTYNEYNQLSASAFKTWEDTYNAEANFTNFAKDIQ